MENGILSLKASNGWIKQYISDDSPFTLLRCWIYTDVFFQKWPQQKHLRLSQQPKVRTFLFCCLRYPSSIFFPGGSSAKESKAKAAKKAVLQGAHSTSKRKTRYSVTFHRPKTLKLPRDPKYPRKSVPHATRMDQFRTIVSSVVFSFVCLCIFIRSGIIDL